MCSCKWQILSVVKCTSVIGHEQKEEIITVTSKLEETFGHILYYIIIKCAFSSHISFNNSVSPFVW